MLEQLSVSLQLTNPLVYERYLEARAAYTGNSAADAEVTPEALEARLRELHQQYVNRELSLVRAADLLGVSAGALPEMWEALGLQLRSVRPRICQC